MSAPYLMHASRSLDSVRPLSNDERRAGWAAKYFLFGLHRRPAKPRIKVTVPEPKESNERKSA